MALKNSGGWLILGLIGLGLFKCGGTKTPTLPSAVYSPPPSGTQSAPVQTAYSLPPVQPLTAPRSLFSEPTTNGYRGEPAKVVKPIRRSLYVRGKEVPMRAEPDARAKILNRLPNGMEVGELLRREGWVEIRHPISAIEGWVSARRLSETSLRTEEQPKQKRKEVPGIEALSDAAIIAKLIALDTAAYSGNCRCPRTGTVPGDDVGREARIRSPEDGPLFAIRGM